MNSPFYHNIPLANASQTPDAQAQTVYVQPGLFVDDATGKYFKLDVLNVELFKSVTVGATLYDEHGQSNGTVYLTLADEEYLNWTNDDQYLMNIVAQKLDFTSKATPVKSRIMK